MAPYVLHCFTPMARGVGGEGGCPSGAACSCSICYVMLCYQDTGARRIQAILRLTTFSRRSGGMRHTRALAIAATALAISRQKEILTSSPKLDKLFTVTPTYPRPKDGTYMAKRLTHTLESGEESLQHAGISFTVIQGNRKTTDTTPATQRMVREGGVS